MRKDDGMDGWRLERRARLRVGEGCGVDTGHGEKCTKGWLCFNCKERLKLQKAMEALCGRQSK